MGLLDKVKNFFYDEEDETDEYEETMPIKVHHKEKKVKVKEKEHKERLRVKEVPEEFEEKQEISERELFKAERTFNFPMDIYDDDYVDNGSIKEEKEDNTNISNERISKPVSTPYSAKKESPYSNIRSYARVEEKKEEKEVKKFKPTPVISPIYGILDKNYKKEDVIIDNASYDKPKKVDYDEVRKKAYKNVYKEEEEEKGIFYNLDDEKKEEQDEDVKIVYNDVTYDEEDENVTIGQKIEEYEKEDENQVDDYESDFISKDEEDDIDDDSKILSETKEQDLFNLIDNMYNSDEDEEEDE